MTRKLTPGDRVRHKVTGHEYTFHAHPSSQDFPGSRYVRDESGAIREFRVDEIEAISTTPKSGKTPPTRLDEIVAAAEDATPGPWEVIPATFEEGRRIKTPAYELMAVDIDAPYLDRTDAEHIAMMDPATTLALVAEVRELRAKVERVETEVRAEAQRARPRPGESSPDAVRRSVSRAIAERLTKALREEA